MHDAPLNKIDFINENKYLLSFNDGPKIMGIINVTPDSFYDGGKYSNSVNEAIEHSMGLIEEGADILDIGGESSRPGATPVSESEEIDRIVPVIEGIRKKSEIPISVDTYKSGVAKYALNSGANWINDISGLRFDHEMKEIVKQYNCPVVVMHMKGNPESMQDNPTYEDVIIEILDFFEERINQLNQQNITKIIIDPGIGFGKTVDHNLKILNQLNKFKKFGLPVLIGASRKSFIGSVLDVNPEKRLIGSLGVLSWSAIGGVDIVRVHDVRESRQTIRMIKSIQDSSN